MFEELARTLDRDAHEQASLRRVAYRLRVVRFWQWLADYATHRVDRLRPEATGQVESGSST
jgi:hypothetical protein